MIMMTINDSNDLKYKSDIFIECYYVRTLMISFANYTYRADKSECVNVQKCKFNSIGNKDYVIYSLLFYTLIKSSLECKINLISFTYFLSHLVCKFLDY